MIQYDALAGKYFKAQEEFYAKVKDESRKALYSMIDSNISGKRILDLGCGYGKDLAWMHNKKAQVYGVDDSKKMLSLATERYPFLTNLSAQNWERLFFPNNFFSLVLSRFSIQHAKSVNSAFKEAHRVLKPGGYFLLLVGHPVMQFCIKKNNSYWKKEKIKVPLFNHKIMVEEQAHTLSEYLSPFVLKHFELVSFKEGPKKSREVSLVQNVPDFLILKFKKK